MSELVRLFNRDGEEEPPKNMTVNDWLDYVEGERDRTIAKLRQLDGILIRGGRRTVETLPRRLR